MSRKYTLTINKIDSVTGKVETIVEAASTEIYELKRIAEREIYYKILHWVFISRIIALVPELHQGADRIIVIGTVEKEPNTQVTIIG